MRGGSLSGSRVAHPKPQEQGLDNDKTLRAVVALTSSIPEDGFTAEALGTKRTGSAVAIRDDGLVLTIGYLITEAESVWLTASDGKVAPGHVVAYDAETGFGLVQALGGLDIPALDIGKASEAKPGDPVIVASGGQHASVQAHIVGKQEFAGYWEYLLDEAIFTAPAHPLWGGAAMIGADGKLLGIGSLLVQQAGEGKRTRNINMVVPIDLLPPIMDDLLAYGRVNKPPRPWLGIYSAESDDKVMVAHVSEHGPAAAAGLRQGDVILAVRDESVESLADFYRKVWKSGPAGTEIPLEVARNGRSQWLRVKSADRGDFLRKPKLH